MTGGIIPDVGEERTDSVHDGRSRVDPQGADFGRSNPRRMALPATSIEAFQKHRRHRDPGRAGILRIRKESPAGVLHLAGPARRRDNGDVLC
jgi:hypothetical protein